MKFTDIFLIRDNFTKSIHSEMCLSIGLNEPFLTSGRLAFMMEHFKMHFSLQDREGYEIAINSSKYGVLIKEVGTLRTVAVPENATIYLSPTAQLILNDATFSGASLFMSANSQVSGEDILVEDGSIVNNGGSFTAANLQLDNSIINSFISFCNKGSPPVKVIFLMFLELT